MKIMPLFKANSLDYLKGLKRNVYLNLFYRGIQDDGSWRLPTDASTLIAQDKKKKGPKMGKVVQFKPTKNKGKGPTTKPGVPAAPRRQQQQKGYNCLMTPVQIDALITLCNDPKSLNDEVAVRFLSVFHFLPLDFLATYVPVLVIHKYDDIQPLVTNFILETFRANTSHMRQPNFDILARTKIFLARYTS
jgi:hypothetical protein